MSRFITMNLDFHILDENELARYDDESWEEIMNEIYELEYDNMTIERDHKQYYLGTYSTIFDNMSKRFEFIFETSIQPTTFFRFPIYYIKDYLYEYGISYHVRNAILIDVFQLYKISSVPSSIYTVIVKTHWIRLIQRTWKRIYRERQYRIKQRKTIPVQSYFAIYGRYPIGLNVLPTLQGMIRTR